MKPCEGIHPIIAYVDEEGKFPCHLIQGGGASLVWVYPHHSQPKCHLPLMVLPGTIKIYAISCWGFSMSPHTPVWKRAKSSESHLLPGIVIGRNRYHEIPIVSGLTPPIGWGFWRIAYSHPLLVIVCKQRKPVIWEAVVSKYLGEMLARVPRCLPPVYWVNSWWEVPRCKLSQERWFKSNSPWHQLKWLNRNWM